MTDWDPDVDYPFDRDRPAAGPGRRTISLSGLSVRLEGLESDADAFVARRFARYLVGESSANVDLLLRFGRDDGAPFLDPHSSRERSREYLMRHAVCGDHLFHASGTLCARLDLATGVGRVLVRPRRGVLEFEDPVPMAIENLLRSCLAWIVLTKGGFMLHAASAVREGRAYLFFGNSGSGKSTLAAICGEPVISDDLTMVLPSLEGYEAIGSPFRGTYTACDDLTQRYPVVALYRLVKDDRVSLETRPRSAAFADFIANLPFVVGELAHRPEGWSQIESAFDRLRVYYLHFRKDPSFWAVIEEEERRHAGASR